MRRTHLTHRRAHPPLTSLSARKQKMTNFNTVSSGMLLLAVTVLAGCTHPLQTSDTEALRHRLLSTYQLHGEAVSAGAVIEVSRPPSEVASELSKERREELDAMSGGESYKTAKLEIGETLLGTDKIDTVHISLKAAFELAIRNNLDIQEARLLPAVRDTELAQAQAAFDAIFFWNFDFNKLDTPQPPAAAGLDVFGSVQSDERTVTVGIRKPLTSGGQITAQTRMTREFRNPTFFGDVDRFYETDLAFTLTQPLMRGFGTDVNRSQIHLSASAKEAALESLRSALLITLFNVEQTYWDLVLARQTLLIQLRLLERTKVDRDTIKDRLDHDATFDEYTQANSNVEQRKAEVLRLQNLVQSRSDTLKRLLNEDNLPLAGETLLVPVDQPMDLPINFSLTDMVRTALTHRPEMRQALLGIKDAGIRQRVAGNLRLPQLDLNFTIRHNGVGINNVGDAQKLITDSKFVDYLLSLQFEVPIGNRGPEALLRQRQIERQTSVVQYQNTAQQVVQQVKDAMRNVATAYRLIGATRDARLAAAENLRVLQELGKTAALTPDFVDRKLRSQEVLANTEINEAQTLADYNTAIARLYQNIGTALKRNGVTFSREATE